MSAAGSGRRGLALALLLLAAAAAGLWLSSPSAAGGSSSLAAGAEGWRGARTYLETRGASVEILDRLPAAKDREAVVVTAFPWRIQASEEHLGGLEEHLRRGGTLVIAYSGRRWQGAETRMLRRMGIEMRALRRDPPLSPWRWKSFAEHEWLLQPNDALVDGGLRPVKVRALELGPKPPSGYRTLYRVSKAEILPNLAREFTEQKASGAPLILQMPVYGGRLVVLPAEALSNGRLSEPGNADLLETLRVSLGDHWAFDELAQGLLPVAQAQAPPPSFDLFALHLLLLYALGLVALARRFGPPWRELRERGSSAAELLRGLGGLHHDLGHHAAAARLLLARRRELAPRIAIPSSFDRRAAADPSSEELVRFAADLARFVAQPSSAPSRSGEAPASAVPPVRGTA